MSWISLVPLLTLVLKNMDCCPYDRCRKNGSPVLKRSWKKGRLLTFGFLGWSQHTKTHRIHGTGIFTHVWLVFTVNGGKYTIHGSYGILGGGFKYFHPYLGKIPIFTNMVWDGLKPPTRKEEMKSQWLSRWWFQRFFIFIPTWGNDPIWLISFQMDWNHQLEKRRWNPNGYGAAPVGIVVIIFQKKTNM